VQTVNRLHRLLAELIPGGAARNLSSTKAKKLLAGVRPRTLVGKTTRRMAAEELADLIRVDSKLKSLKAELKAAVLARGSHLMDLRGIGPAGAARILADVGDIARFPGRDHFASWTGTAPLDASSGDHIRQRLSRAGNRRMNHVLYVAAITQIRQRLRRAPVLPPQAPGGQDRQGRTALPQAAPLRPGLSPAPSRRQAGRSRRGAAIEGGPGRAHGGVYKILRGRPTHPGHRLFGSATTRARSTDATRHPASPNTPGGVGIPAPASARGDKHRRTLKDADTASLTQRGTEMTHFRWAPYSR